MPGTARQPHQPVMPVEVLRFLDPEPGMVILDGTTGEAGHSRLIAEKIGADGRLICLDLDSSLIEIARENLTGVEAGVDLVNINFKRFKEALDDLGVAGLDGILVDLGVASYHFDTPERGFSFRFDGPLDMRLNRKQELTAEEVINNYSEKELAGIFAGYGEERRARHIARAIIKERGERPIKTTTELADLISEVAPGRNKKIHPATKVFQALRIVVNRELEELEDFFKSAVRRLNPGGKMVVISFHSLEDRVAKDTFRFLAKDCVCPPEFPVCICDKRADIKILTTKPVIPSQEEIERNPRARSSKLRAVEKLQVKREV